MNKKLPKIKYTQLKKRITGFSASILGFGGGISWKPEKEEKDIAKEIINFLEDRRVLFNPFSMECTSHCISSVQEIRKFLTNQISNTSQFSELNSILRLLRSASRKFIDDFSNSRNNHPMHHRFYFMDRDNPNLAIALGELRAVFGIQTLKLSQMYKIDIEKDLATIIPVK